MDLKREQQLVLRVAGDNPPLCLCRSQSAVVSSAKGHAEHSRLGTYVADRESSHPLMIKLSAGRNMNISGFAGRC